MERVHRDYPNLNANLLRHPGMAGRPGCRQITLTTARAIARFYSSVNTVVPIVFCIPRGLRQLAWGALAGMVLSWQVSAAAVNYDEAKVGPCTLPDPLRMEDGRPVTDAAMWHQARRPELLALFRREVYGQPLPRPAQMHFEVVREDPHYLGGRATRRDVSLRIAGGADGTVLAFALILPNRQRGPVPVFVGLHLFDLASAEPRPAVARRLPGAAAVTDKENRRAGLETLDQLLAGGYGLASLDIDLLAADSATDYWKGAARLMGRTEGGPPGPAESGALGLWAWGLSRTMDYFETLPAINASKVAVIGHSRMGKSALWAAANDGRFGMAISNNSGCGGAALNRRDYGETVAIITKAFPHWFCGNFARHAGQEQGMPVDQHELVALMAPRPVYIASAVEDRWADPRGEFLAALHAEPVYRLLNAGGLGVTELPEPDHPVGGTIGYHLRSGQHDLTDYDWQQYLRFAGLHWGRAGK